MSFDEFKQYGGRRHSRVCLSYVEFSFPFSQLYQTVTQNWGVYKIKRNIVKKNIQYPA